MRDDRGDLLVVLLVHHHVAVAFDAEVGEPHEGRLDSRLLQVLHGAVVIGCVIGRLRHHHQDRHFQVGQLARRLRLQVAPDQIRSIGLVLLRDRELLGVGDRGRIGQRHRAQPIGQRQRALLEVVRRADEIDLIERRSVRLDRKNRLDLVGPRIRHRPAEGAGLRMHHQDGGPDLVDERHQRVAVEDLLLGEVLDLRQIARDHLQRDRIVGRAAAGPLRVQMRLRPELVFRLREVAALAAVAVRHLPGPVALGEIAGASAPGLVHHIDGVTLAHEILRPALAAVGRAEIGGGGTGAAMDHDDGIGMRLLRRNAEIHVHLAGDVGAAVDGGGLAADVEEAFARQRIRRIVVGARPAGRKHREHDGSCRRQYRGFHHIG